MIVCKYMHGLVSPNFFLLFGLIWAYVKDRLEVLEVLAYDVSLLLAFLQSSLWAMVNGVSLGLLPQWGSCYNRWKAQETKNFLSLCILQLQLQYTCAHIFLLQIQQPELDNLCISVHLDSLKIYHACSDLQTGCDLQHDAAWNNVGWSLQRLALRNKVTCNISWSTTCFHDPIKHQAASITKQATELLWWCKPKHAVLSNYWKLNLTATKKTARNIRCDWLMHNSLLALSCTTQFSDVSACASSEIVQCELLLWHTSYTSIMPPQHSG